MCASVSADAVTKVTVAMPSRCAIGFDRTWITCIRPYGTTVSLRMMRPWRTSRSCSRSAYRHDSAIRGTSTNHSTTHPTASAAATSANGHSEAEPWTGFCDTPGHYHDGHDGDDGDGDAPLGDQPRGHRAPVEIRLEEERVLRQVLHGLRLTARCDAQTISLTGPGSAGGAKVGVLVSQRPAPGTTHGGTTGFHRPEPGADGMARTAAQRPGAERDDPCLEDYPGPRGSGPACGGPLFVLRHLVRDDFAGGRVGVAVMMLVTASVTFAHRGFKTNVIPRVRRVGTVNVTRPPRTWWVREVQ